MLVLLDGQIPHEPGVATMLGQHHLLLSSRKQPVSRHSFNQTPTTDNTHRKAKPRFLLRLSQAFPHRNYVEPAVQSRFASSAFISEGRRP